MEGKGGVQADATPIFPECESSPPTSETTSPQLRSQNKPGSWVSARESAKQKVCALLRNAVSRDLTLQCLSVLFFFFFFFFFWGGGGGSERRCYFKSVLPLCQQARIASR